MRDTRYDAICFFSFSFFFFLFLFSFFFSFFSFALDGLGRKCFTGIWCSSFRVLGGHLTMVKYCCFAVCLVDLVISFGDTSFFIHLNIFTSVD